jgi:hypothetical protein
MSSAVRAIDTAIADCKKHAQSQSQPQLQSLQSLSVLSPAVEIDPSDLSQMGDPATFELSVVHALLACGGSLQTPNGVLQALRHLVCLVKSSTPTLPVAERSIRSLPALLLVSDLVLLSWYIDGKASDSTIICNFFFFFSFSFLLLLLLFLLFFFYSISSSFLPVTSSISLL